MHIKIKNYENLVDLDIKANPGLTQIYGETNQGKSCFVRAISDFANNSATVNEITAQELKKNKKTEMLIQVGENYFKRDSKNKSYFINGERLDKPGQKKYDVGIDEANFQLQQEQPFLVKWKPQVKYDYIVGRNFDNHLENIQSLNREAVQLKKEHELYGKEVDRIDHELISVEKSVAELRHYDFTSLKNKLLEKNKVIKLTYSLIEKDNEAFDIEKSMKKIVNTTKLEKGLIVLKGVEKLKEKYQEKKKIKKVKLVDTEKLVATYKTLFNLNKLFKRMDEKESILLAPRVSTKRLDVLKNKKDILIKTNKLLNLYDDTLDLKMAKTVSTKQLETKFEKLQRISKKTNELKKLKSNIEKISEEIVYNKKQIKKLNNELEGLRGKIDICPLCGTEVGGVRHEHAE